MCEPVTLAMSGLRAVSTFAGIQAQNQAAGRNAAVANQAANDGYAQETQGFIEKNRSLIQGGFDAVLEGRAAESTAYASAIENGVQGASVRSMLRSARQKTQRSLTRTTQEMESLGNQTDQKLNNIRTQAQGNINSVPRTSLGLGDLTGILAPIVRSEME